MKYPLLAATILAAAIPLSAADFTLSTENGKLPAGVTAANENGIVPIASYYRNGYTKDGWIIDRVGTRGFVPVCPTFNADHVGAFSSLILPELEIASGDMLTFEARSILPRFEERYAVLVTPQGGETEVPFICESAPSRWCKQGVSLEPWAGKKVSIKIVALSEYGYMLALDNIAVQKGKADFDAIAMPHRFYGLEDIDDDGMVQAAFSIRNVGPALGSGAFVAKAGGKVTARITAAEAGNPATGEEFDLHVTLPAALGETTAYELWWEDGATAVKICASDFHTSHFRRMLYVDEATGMWCNNCPVGTLHVQNFEAEYPLDVAVGITHYYTDPLSNASMWKELHWYDMPRMMLNHITATNGDKTEKFTPYLKPDTDFEITLSQQPVLYADGVLVADFGVRTASEADNASGRYRVAALLTQDMDVTKGFYQENSCLVPAYEQYFFLPTTIGSALLKYDDVVISGGPDAFQGFESSLPATLAPGQTYEYSHRWTREDIAIDKTELADLAKARVIALLLDTEQGIVLNAAKCDVRLDSGNAPEIQNSGDDPNEGSITGVDAEAAAAPVYNLQGIKVADTPEALKTLPRGMYICAGRLVRN